MSSLSQEASSALPKLSPLSSIAKFSTWTGSSSPSTWWRKLPLCSTSFNSWCGQQGLWHKLQRWKLREAVWSQLHANVAMVGSISWEAILALRSPDSLTCWKRSGYVWPCCLHGQLGISWISNECTLICDFISGLKRTFWGWGLVQY